MGEVIQAKQEWHKWVIKDPNKLNIKNKSRAIRAEKIIESMRECSFSPKINKRSKSKFQIYSNSKRLFKDAESSIKKKEKLASEHNFGLFKPKIKKFRHSEKKLKKSESKPEGVKRDVNKNKEKGSYNDNDSMMEINLLNRSKSEINFKEEFSHLTKDLHIEIKNPEDSSLIKSSLLEKNEGIESFFHKYPVQKLKEDPSYYFEFREEDFRGKRNFKTFNKKKQMLSIYLEKKDKKLIENLLKKVDVYEKEMLEEKKNLEIQRKKIEKDNFELKNLTKNRKGKLENDINNKKRRKIEKKKIRVIDKLNIQEIFKDEYIEKREIKRRKVKKKKTKTKGIKRNEASKEKNIRKERMKSALTRYKKSKNREKTLKKKLKKEEENPFKSTKKPRKMTYDEERTKDLKDAKKILKSRIMKSLMSESKRGDLEDIPYTKTSRNSSKAKKNYSENGDFSMLNYNRNVADVTFSGIDEPETGNFYLDSESFKRGYKGGMMDDEFNFG